MDVSIFKIFFYGHNLYMVYKVAKQNNYSGHPSISSQQFRTGENDRFCIVYSKFNHRRYVYTIISSMKCLLLVKLIQMKYFLLSSLPRMKPKSDVEQKPRFCFTVTSFLDFSSLFSPRYWKELLESYDYLKIFSNQITQVFSVKMLQKNITHHHFILLNLSIITLCLKGTVFFGKHI